MPNMKKTSPMKPKVLRAPSKGVKTLMPKVSNKPNPRKPAVRDVNAPPSPRRLLANSRLAESAPKRLATAGKKAAANTKAVKRAPLETKRVGGIFSVPVKPKKTIY